MSRRRQLGMRLCLPAATVCAVLLHAAIQKPGLAAPQEASPTAFGPCVRKALEFTPGSVTVHRRSQSRMVDVGILPANGNTLHTFALTDSASIVSSGIAPLGGRYQSIRSADIDADGATEHVLVSEEPGAIAVARRQAGRLELTRYEIKEERPERCEIADVNTDGRPDILTYGRAMVGVRTFLNAGRGEFREGPTLFPEISVADLRAADLDRDGVSDIILSDWISDRILAYKGISRSQYSEPLALDLPGEPGGITLLESAAGGLHLLAVSILNRSEVRVYSRRGAGEFSPLGTVSYSSAPSSVQLADVDLDGTVDVISATALSLQVSFLSPGGKVASTSSYGLATGTGLWRIADIDGDSLPDLVAADTRQKTLCIVANAAWRGRVHWPDTYLVGLQPGFVSIGDIDGRSGPDLAVTSEGSSAVSILLSRGGGRFSGPSTVAVPDRPTQVMVQAASSSGPATLVTSHATGGTIALTPLGTSSKQVGAEELPGCTRPTILCATRDDKTRRQSVLLLCREEQTSSVSLVLFREAEGGQFVEQNIAAPEGAQVVAAAPVPSQTDCGGSLLMLSRESSPPHRLSAYRITMEHEGLTQARPLVMSLPEGTTGIASGDLNADALPDVVMSQTGGRGIAVAFGKKGASPPDAPVWCPESGGLSVVAVTDLNSDRCADILLRSREGSAVKVIYGRRDRTLLAPVSVATIPQGADIAAGRLGRGTASDLVVADGRLNTIQILFDLFGR